MSGKVVVALPDSDNEYQVLQAEDAQATAARLGLEVEVLNAGSNAVQQIQQLFKLLNAAERPKAILVEPVTPDGMERVARKAAQSGVGWAILNCTVGWVGALRRDFGSVPVFSVGSDQVEIGRLQGQQMRILLPSGGTALYVEGPLTTTAAQERLKGMQEALVGSDIHTIVLDAQWSEESAEHALRQWLRLKTSESVRVDLVAAQDDSMARGARRAAEGTPDAAKRWADVPFLGIDGVPEVGQKLVRSAQLTATVVMPSNTGPALEAVARWLQSGQLPPASIRVPVASFPDDEQLRRHASRRRTA